MRSKQFKFKNMARGLDEDETNFLDEVSRQQELIEKQRREEELEELKEYRISFVLREKCLAFLRSIKRPSTWPLQFVSTDVSDSE